MANHDEKTSKEKRSKKILAFLSVHWAIVISIVFHSALLIKKVNDEGWFDKTVTKSKKEPKRIRLVLAPKKNNPKQIVTTEQNGRKEKPEEAKYFGKTNQTFDRQTAAKKVGSFKMAGKGKRDGRKAKPKVKPQKTIVKGTQKKQKTTKSKRGKKQKKDLSLANLGFGNMDQKKVHEPVESFQALGLDAGDASRTGLAQNNDYVEDVPLGDMTNLNTVEYKYYGFYHRIKQKLEQYWGNTLQKKAEALWKSGRRIPASEQRITSLLITIDTKGNIVDIKVKGTSGVRELDDAAIESFNRAGPFPNPPKGMMKNGMAQIEWGFVVKS